MVTGTRFKKTASSFFVINNQNPDDGFVISQKKISISKNDNSNSLYKKILRVAVLQLPIIMNFFLKKKDWVSKNQLEAIYGEKETIMMER